MKSFENKKDECRGKLFQIALYFAKGSFIVLCLVCFKMIRLIRNKLLIEANLKIFDFILERFYFKKKGLNYIK